MTELTPIWLRALGWLLLLPIPLVGILPWWLHRRLEGPLVFSGHWGQWLGLWLILNGLGLAGWCVFLFITEGKGTPFPLDPPTQFVARGPYRFVRNPMVLGMFLVLVGQAALYRSATVLLYTVLASLVMHLFVCFVEEPDLARRFGSAYAAYRQQVPRWVPRPISGAPQLKKR